MNELILTFDGPVATLTLNRPDRRNALDHATWRALPIRLDEAILRHETRVIVLRGAQGNFAAGADISEFDTVFADRAGTLAYLDDMSAATAAIEAATLPVIALLEGLCIGAGVALALSCDLRFAAADARFAVTPAKLGLMYSLADTKRLTDSVGLSAAKDLLFTGRTIDAGRAASLGLIDEIFPPAELEAAVNERASLIAIVSPWSNTKSKAIVRAIANGTIYETDGTRQWFADAPEGSDFHEGVAAFRARRPPVFPPR